MINKYIAIGFGALIALAPVAALAQEQVAQAATDSTSMAAPTTGHTGSHKGHCLTMSNTISDQTSTQSAASFLD